MGLFNIRELRYIVVVNQHPLHLVVKVARIVLSLRYVGACVSRNTITSGASNNNKLMSATYPPPALNT
jgi:hypothetical protein